MDSTFEKSASTREAVVEAAKRVADWVRKNPHQIAGGAVGGGLSALGTYLVSKPGKSGRSVDQGKSSELERPKEGESFTKGMSRIVSNTRKEVADLAARHPAQMALSSVPAGVAMGRMVANKLKTGSVMHGMSPDEMFELADSWGRELARSEHSKREQLYAAVEKVAETEKERAHKWGKRGAIGYGGLNALALLTQAAKGARHPADVVVGSLGGFGLGYGGGRLAHRIVHGKATDKKVKEKKAAGVVPMPNVETLKAIGTKALGKARDIIKEHPVKSTLGALAVGRYVMPKKDRD